VVVLYLLFCNISVGGHVFVSVDICGLGWTDPVAWYLWSCIYEVSQYLNAS